MRKGCFLAVLLALCAATPCFADTTLMFDIGWGNHYRPGKWNPIYIIAADDKPREAEVELYAPTGRRYAMQIRQSFAISQQQVTIPIYAPLSYQLDETTLTLRDATSYRRLISVALSDTPAYQRVGPGMADAVGSDRLFIGISGKMETERLVEGQISHGNITPAFLPPERLPASVAGYDALDLLMLNQPDLNRIDIDQQRAIIDWVRAGGVLVVWPGPEPIPEAGPIVDNLPCRFGKTTTYTLSPDRVQKLGLPTRFAKLTGRIVSAVASDAKTIPLFGNGVEPVAYRHWVGFGQIIAMPVDLSLFQFNNGGDGLSFWREALRGIVTIPVIDANQQQSYNYFGDGADPRQTAATQRALNWVADVPGASSFGFSYIAGTLIALMFVVGPVDWFVLKWLGRQPWTWVTTAGWIGLVTFSAIYIGHVFKSGELHFRTVSLLDEIGGARVASTDLVGVYAPRTTEYDLATETESWWRPTAEQNWYGGGGNIHIEIPVHQDYRGTRPLPLPINVWNIRFLQGDQIGSAAPTIGAKLTQSNGELHGTIGNLAGFAINPLAVRTNQGVLRLSGKIEPGASMPISGKLNRKDRTFATTQMTQQERWQMYNMNQESSAQPSLPTAGDIAAERSDRIDQLLKDRDDVAVIYAQFEAPPERVKLEEKDVKEQHVGLIRAVVPIE
jgi:hypothetical protein